MAKKEEPKHEHKNRMSLADEPAAAPLAAGPNSFQRELERQIEDLQSQVARKQELLQLVIDNQALAEDLIKRYRSN